MTIICSKLQRSSLRLLILANNYFLTDLRLNGKDSLAERFAEIDNNRIIDKMKDAREVESKVPGKIKQFIRKVESMSKLLYLLSR